MKTTLANNFKGLLVNNGTAALNSNLIEYLEKIDNFLGSVTSSNRHVYMARFDLKFPENFPQDSNHFELVRKFIEKLVRPVNRLGAKLHYLWVKDQKNGTQPQYQFILLVTDNFIKTCEYLNKALGFWVEQLKKTMHENYSNIDNSKFYEDRILRVVINKNDKKNIDCVFYWASVLARNVGKEINTSQKSIGHTRISTKHSLSDFITS